MNDLISRRRVMGNPSIEIIPTILLTDAYIATDIILSGDLEFEGIVGYGNNRDPRNSVVFGTQEGTSSLYDRYVLYTGFNPPRHTMGYGTKILGDKITIGENPSINRYSGKIVGSNFRFDIDNVVHYDTPKASFYTPQKVLIGACHNLSYSTDPVIGGPILVSDIAFFRGGVELAKFKAARRGSEYGIYDELSDVFLAKSGGVGEITPFSN